MYNAFLGDGRQVGAGYGAGANTGGDTNVDIDSLRAQGGQLAGPIADPNAQAVATETRVGQYQATNARDFGNFVRARVAEAEAVNEDVEAGIELGVDADAIVQTGGAHRQAVGRAASGTAAAAEAAERARPLGAWGPVSGREFDPAAAGGPIRQLTTDRIRITRRGIDTVEQHVARFGPDPTNQGMIQRLGEIAAGRLQPTQADLNFYSHELREFVRYRQL